MSGARRLSTSAGEEGGDDDDDDDVDDDDDDDDDDMMSGRSTRAGCSPARCCPAWAWLTCPGAARPTRRRSTR